MKSGITNLRRPNIQRVDSARTYNHGWLLILQRRGRIYRRSFSDNRWGGRGAALRAALKCRSELLKRLPTLRRFHLKHSTNTTGVVGVSLSRIGKRRVLNYRAGWREADGRVAARYFSVLKYGKGEAKRRAIAARREASRRLLGSAT